MTLEQFTQELKSDSIWWETIMMVHRGKNIDECIGFAYLDLIAQPERFKQATVNDFKRLVNGWLSNKKPVKPAFVKRDISNL